MTRALKDLCLSCKPSSLEHLAIGGAFQNDVEFLRAPQNNCLRPASQALILELGTHSPVLKTRYREPFNEKLLAETLMYLKLGTYSLRTYSAPATNAR